jgi:putative sigma-54 modulation protein
MQLNISGHHVEITEALREYVQNKLGKIERHIDGITNVQMTLSVEKLIQKAEITLHGIGKEVVAHAEHKDMYAAIDALIDKVDRQLIKLKEKRQSH